MRKRKEFSLTFREYQEKSRQTAIYPNKNRNFIYPTLGLSGETGEVAEIIKKIIRDQKGKIDRQTKQQLLKELGDVLWYLANLATELKLSLEKIASSNLEKLASRQKRGKLQGSGDER